MPDPEPGILDGSNQTLSDIVRGMQHAVNESQRMLEVHFHDVLERYFEDDRTPKMVEFKVGEGHVIRAPLITLIHPNGLHLSELDLQFAIRVQREAVKELTNPEDMALKAKLEAEIRRDEETRKKHLEMIQRLERDVERGDATARLRLQEHQAFVQQLDERLAGLRGRLRSVISRSSVNVSFAPRTGEEGSNDSVIDVTMKFKAEQQPEGMSRIVDEFTRVIGPVFSTETDEPTTPALRATPPESGGGNETDPDIPPDSA